MKNILIIILIISTIILAGCSSYNAEFQKCKEIKVHDSGCKRFSKFMCDNRTIDFEIEKECYKEVKGYVTVGYENDTR